MKAFWIAYEIILLICEALFIFRVQAIWSVLAQIKRRYALTLENGTDGHRQSETCKGILSALKKCRTELAAWCIIAAVTAYACVDCLVYWIVR